MPAQGPDTSPDTRLHTGEVTQQLSHRGNLPRPRSPPDTPQLPSDTSVQHPHSSALMPGGRATCGQHPALAVPAPDSQKIIPLSSPLPAHRPPASRRGHTSPRSSAAAPSGTAPSHPGPTKLSGVPGSHAPHSPLQCLIPPPRPSIPTRGASSSCPAPRRIDRGQTPGLPRSAAAPGTSGIPSSHSPLTPSLHSTSTSNPHSCLPAPLPCSPRPRVRDPQLPAPFPSRSPTTNSRSAHSPHLISHPSVPAPGAALT